MHTPRARQNVCAGSSGYSDTVRLRHALEAHCRDAPTRMSSGRHVTASGRWKPSFHADALVVARYGSRDVLFANHVSLREQHMIATSGSFRLVASRKSTQVAPGDSVSLRVFGKKSTTTVS